MDTSSMSELFAQHRDLLVFSNVLLQQLGLPVPAVPTMMLNASQVQPVYALIPLLLAAVCASVIADLLWYQAGKIFGYKVLNFLCKMSINPGSCVNQTEARFHRWGVWSLVMGKFIPGFSTVAPPVAGALGMSRSAFLIASAIGAGLWAGLALIAGYALQAQIAVGTAFLSEHGVRIVTVFALILAAWMAWKFWQKKRFERLAAIPHISAKELAQAYADRQMPRIIDLRSKSMIKEAGSIPHAVVSELNAVGTIASGWPKEDLIVTICACPGDAAAVHAAHTLKAMGFNEVKPLAGGFEAWQSQAEKQEGLLVFHI
ncbi:MAG: VTT domain-containing protein [Burkholderiales bacterium]|nr:VTT domain-containing protein [Burkholderiales bacterium]